MRGNRGSERAEMPSLTTEARALKCKHYLMVGAPMTTGKREELLRDPISIIRYPISVIRYQLSIIRYPIRLLIGVSLIWVVIGVCTTNFVWRFFVWGLKDSQLS